MKTFLVEFVGTMIFVLTFGLTLVPPGVGPFAPLAIGLMLAAMIYAGGPVSGGHFNPAVTLAVWLRGKCAGKVVLPYVLAQLVAGALAGILVNYLRSGTSAASAVPTVHDLLKLGVVEFIFTFALVYVFLAVATSSKNVGNSYSGLAVGAAVLGGMYAGLPLSGGAYNPAVTVGTSLMGLGSWDLLWIYLLAQLAAGACAAMMYKTTHSEEFQK
jgi:aquaporin Z